MRCGVVGLGLVGRQHAEIIASLPGCDLVICVDVDPAREAACPSGVRFTTDVAAIGDEALDAVIVATPENIRNPVVAALTAGAVVLCEKPLASSVEEADEIIMAAERSDGRLLVAHTLRFDPRYRAVRESIATGVLGSIVHLAARRAMWSPEGVIYAPRTTLASCLGVHDLDVMRWYAGEIERVYAENGPAHLFPGTADSTVATVRFGSGAVGVLELTWGLPEATHIAWDTSLVCVGTERAVYVEMRGADPNAVGIAGSLMPELTYAYAIAGIPGGVLRTQAEHFVREVREPGTWPGASLADARRAVEVALALEMSAAEGRPINL